MLWGFIAGCIFMMLLAVLMEWDDNRRARKASKKRMKARRARGDDSGLSL